MKMPLDAQLSQIDKELASKGVRVPNRIPICFRRVHGSVPDGAQRDALFQPICDWYAQKYGERSHWDGVIAVFPVLVRDNLLSSRAKAQSTDSLVVYTEAIEGLPSSLKDQLTVSDFHEVAGKMQQANINWRLLYNLTVDDSMLPTRASELVDRAIHDLENAGLVLYQNQDVHTSMVQAHEAAEKFIKAALLYAGFSESVEIFRHNITKAYNVLIAIDPRYSALPKPTQSLADHVPNMQLRYAPSNKTVEDAMSAYHSSLHVCATLARIWTLDLERGTQISAFEPRCFYRTSIGADAYCTSATTDEAVLLHFRPVADRFLRYEIQLDQRESALYLKVTEPAELRDLLQKLRWYLHTCNRPVPSEESNLAIIDDIEGSFAVSRMKLKLNKPIR